MNKKLHLLAALGLFSLSLNAQTTLSQTGGVAPTTNTIFCPQKNANNENTGIYESSYYRSYTMTAATKIISVKVGNIVNLAQGVANFPITVKLYKSNGAFPGSYPSGLTQLATVNKSLNKSAVDPQNKLIPATENILFSSPIPVAAGDVIVVEVTHGDVNGGLFLMGAIDPAGTATGVGYMKANKCSIATPTDISTIPVTGGTGNGKIVLDLVENSSASSEDFFKENFMMYPNPTTDVLNITSKNGLNANEIRISDLTGKVVKVQKDASAINVSDLATGTYLIDITTNEGKATSKFIKK